MVSRESLSSALEIKGTPRVASAAFASTLAHGLDVMAALEPDGAGISNSRLAAKLGMPRSMVSRLCSTLVQLGYLSKGSDGLFRPAARTLALAYPMLSGLPQRHHAWHLMNEFATTWKVNVSMTMLAGTYLINLLAVQHERQRPALPPEVGKMAPVEISVAGYCLLAMLPIEQRRSFERQAALERPTSWDKHKDDVGHSMAHARSRGYCVSTGGPGATVATAASPLGITSEGYFLALSSSFSSQRSTAAELESEFGPKVAALAREIRRQDLTLSLACGGES